MSVPFFCQKIQKSEVKLGGTTVIARKNRQFDSLSSWLLSGYYLHV